MILRPRKKAKNTIDSGSGVGTRSYGEKKIFHERDGVQVRERKMGERILYTAESLGQWMHPWYTTVSWFTRESGTLKNNKGEVIEGFAAVVNPGFVNGVDPVCPGSQKIKVGEEETSSDLLSGGDKKDVLAEPGLLDGPLIPLFDTFSLVTRKGGIPAGLADLGAVHYQDGMSVSGEAIRLEEVPENPRYVATTGLYLQCARPTSKMDVSTFNFPIDAIEYNVSYDIDIFERLGVRARLGVGSPPPNQKPTIMDKFAGSYTDPGIDCWMIATIYLLSPENPETDDKGPKITEAWVPYVKHHTYWNLEYRFKMVPPVNSPSGIARSALPLLAFTGRYSFAGQGVLASMESGMNRLLAAVFNSKNTEGRFWTI
jgi:hypothetical protein